MCQVTPKPSPNVVLNLIMDFRRSKTMFAAVALGVFDALASGPKSLEYLAKVLRPKPDAMDPDPAPGLNPDALERLLVACVGLQLLEFRDDCYENTPASATYLCSCSPDSVTGYIKSSNDVFWHLWGNLEGAIQEGTHRWKQTFNLEGPYWKHIFKTDKAMEEFLLGMHGYGQITSPKLVQAFDLSEYRTLVDLGGGTGHLAIAACRRYPKLEAIVFELAEAAPLARKTISAVEDDTVRRRIQVVEGDFFTVDFPRADVYCLARTIHDWKEDKVVLLLERVFERLHPGGALIIAEKILNEDKSGPFWAQMQNLNMLVLAEGKERTLTEYTDLLRKIGFGSVDSWTPDSPLDFIRAVKPGGTQIKDSRLEPLEATEVRERRPRKSFPDEADFYFAFFENAAVGFVVAKWDGQFVLVNQKFAEILGRPVEEVRAMKYQNITPKWYAEEDAEQIQTLDKTGLCGPFRKQYLCKNPKGEDVLVSVRVNLQKISIRDKPYIWASVVVVD
jgi:acetylserotonin N-methyltransferase